VLQSRFSTLMKAKQSLKKQRKPLNSTKHTNGAEASKAKNPQHTCDANDDDNKTGKVGMIWYVQYCITTLRALRLKVEHRYLSPPMNDIKSNYFECGQIDFNLKDMHTMRNNASFATANQNSANTCMIILSTCSIVLIDNICRRNIDCICTDMLVPSQRWSCKTQWRFVNY